MDTYRAIKEFAPETIGVIITGYGAIEMAIEATKLGFAGFVTKPFTPKQLNEAVSEVPARRRLERENVRLKALVPLCELSKTFMTTTDLDELLNQVVHTAKQETKADRVSLMLLDGGKGELTVQASIGLSEDVVTTTRQELGGGWLEACRRCEVYKTNPSRPGGPPARRGYRPPATG